MALACEGLCAEHRLRHACRIENRFAGGPWRYYCDPATVGEFWYDDYIKNQLQGPLQAQCGQARMHCCSSGGSLQSHSINRRLACTSPWGPSGSAFY